jgi:hypothetical protein
MRKSRKEREIEHSAALEKMADERDAIVMEVVPNGVEHHLPSHPKRTHQSAHLFDAERR